MSNSKITAYVLRDLCGDACLNKGNEADLMKIQQWLQENELNHDLLKKSAGYRDNYRYTPLHYLVCAHPSLNLVEKLIQLAPETVKVKNISGCLPLHLCCGYGASTEVIKMILEAYPEAAQIQDNNGRLPLHISCKFDASSDVKKMLLKAYPTASEVQDKDGELVLHLLCRSNSPSPDVIRMVIEANPKATEVQDNYGMLPLHWTCYHMAPIDIERLLVGAFPEGISKKDNTGKVPLDHARDKGVVSKELLSLLSQQKGNYRRGSIAGSIAAFMPQFPKNWLSRCVQARGA